MGDISLILCYNETMKKVCFIGHRQIFDSSVREKLKMNEKYYRITAYCKQEDFTCILDSNGMFEKLWQFSSYLVSKGFNIIDATKLENILDTNITNANVDNNHIVLQATQDGGIEPKDYTIKVKDKFYTTNNQ